MEGSLSLRALQVGDGQRDRASTRDDGGEPESVRSGRRRQPECERSTELYSNLRASSDGGRRIPLSRVYLGPAPGPARAWNLLELDRTGLAKSNNSQHPLRHGMKRPRFMYNVVITERERKSIDLPFPQVRQ